MFSSVSTIHKLVERVDLYSFGLPSSSHKLPSNKSFPGDDDFIDRQRMVKRVIIIPTKTLLLGSEPIAETAGD